MTIHHLTVDNDTATHTSTQCNHDKVFHTTGSTVSHFTDSSSICIVCQSSGDTQSFFKHGSQRKNSFPRQVRSKFNRSRVIVTIRSTDTDTSDFINATISNNQWKQAFTHFISVFFYCRITRCFDWTAGNNSSACVYNSKDGIRSAYVNTYYVGLFHVWIHDTFI